MQATGCCEHHTGNSHDARRWPGRRRSRGSDRACPRQPCAMPRHRAALLRVSQARAANCTEKSLRASTSTHGHTKVDAQRHNGAHALHRTRDDAGPASMSRGQSCSHQEPANPWASSANDRPQQPRISKRVQLFEKKEDALQWSAAVSAAWESTHPKKTNREEARPASRCDMACVPAPRPGRSSLRAAVSIPDAQQGRDDRLGSRTFK
jgi:hypothetical protein